MRIPSFLHYALALVLAAGLATSAQAQRLAPEDAAELGLLETNARQTAPPPAVRGGPEVCVDDVLLVPDSGDDAVSTFDPQTGDLIDPLFIVDPANLSTPKNALPNFDRDGVFVSDQLGDAVFEYDCNGDFVGIFAPAGGVDNAILDNVRGMDYSPDGTELWVTNGGGPNEDTVARFDQSGTYLGNLFPNGANGLVSPFDVLVRDEDVLVSDFLGDPIFRYDFSGNFLGVFQEPSSTLNAPQQLGLADNDNVLAAGFSSPRGGYEFSPTGQQLAVYSAVSGSPAGVYELPNGNILVSSGSGLQEVTRQNVLVRTIDDASQYIELFAAGTGGPIGISAAAGAQSYPQGGRATFSYEVCNNTPVAVSGVVFYEVFRKPSGAQVAGPVRVVAGSVPANSCTPTLQFAVNVPAGAPLGDYNVAVSAGPNVGTAVATSTVMVAVTASARAAGTASWTLAEAEAWPTAAAATTAPTEVSVYPNPLAGQAQIAFSLDAPTEVRLAVYDVLGREVAVLADGQVDAGSHAATFDAAELPSGVYLVRLEAGGQVTSHRVTVVR